MTRTAEFWNSTYDNNIAPWVIGEPQPAVVALERDGWISGRVLEPGCGAGEHTILLTKLGYDVLGIDLSSSAIEFARGNAAAQGVPSTRFEVRDAIAFGDAGLAPFDTILDSALFHVFGTEPDARAAYVRSLHALCKPGGLVVVLALSDAGPGFGPQISDAVIRESFTDGWELEELQTAEYRGLVTEGALEQNPDIGVAVGEKIDLPAWRARIRRV
ncbi:thiopurine S-methyltransferase [Nocardia tenerifensis]|uniref:Thiopurine S-methyltransferase n=1 Tax=Nocardia tenerifensis TaxID=228006 RepID=A0A318KJY6_9NOCA|nr:class I SAM-dependent methyltransferase [Nocardia tenerifensis]PXX61596.1 thiopurine S-methyltransferase [Nocardia tenerifensis]